MNRFAKNVTMAALTLLPVIKTAAQNGIAQDAVKKPVVENRKTFLQDSLIASLHYDRVDNVQRAARLSENQTALLFDAVKGSQTDRVLILYDGFQDTKITLTVPHANDPTLLVPVSGSFHCHGMKEELGFKMLESRQEKGKEVTRKVTGILPTQKGAALLQGLMDGLTKEHDIGMTIGQLLIPNGGMLTDLENFATRYETPAPKYN